MIEETNIETPVEQAPVPADKAASAETVRVRKRVRVRRESTSHPRQRFFQRLPLWLWLVALALAGLGAFSANPVLTPVSIVLLPVFATLLWFRGEPPVLLFACGIQWLQAAVAVFYSDFYGLALSADLINAIWLSLIGVLVLGIGMRVALVRREGDIAGQAEQEARQLDPAKIFAWYLIGFVGFYFVGRLASAFPSMRQPVVATQTLQWVLVVLLAHSVLAQRRHYALLLIVVALEFFAGLLGFFASFKSVFFILLVVLPTARFIFKGWRLAQFCATAVLVLLLCILWTVIKGEYREFLNQGSGMQEVVVTVPERIQKLDQLIGGLNRSKFDEGLEQVILRVSYVSYFAMVMMNVPENLPYENGALWFGAIKHVLMPRFLFPKKAALDDSARTSYYTGVQVAGEEQGTSIGIGYIAESYIDFGPIGMFVPVLLLGALYGLVYRFFVGRQGYRVLGFAMATSILVFTAFNLETSNIKLVGGCLMSLIVMGLFAKFASDRFWALLTVERGVRPTRRKPLRPAR